MMSVAKVLAYGEAIEYLEDRLYLTSYSQPPTAQTPFIVPSSPEKVSPTKRGRNKAKGATTTAAASAAASTSSDGKDGAPFYFSIDELLLYNAFFADFGPLHIGHLYRFSVYLHNILADAAYAKRRIVLWSKDDSRSRANTACLLACYMVLIQSWPPHLALAPIVQADPPYMPFRDAGYSQADFVLGIQDVVYGVWRAKEENLCGLSGFSLEEYETFERSDMGDFNWISPSFLAFASPQHNPVQPIPSSSPLFAKLPKDIAGIKASTLPTPFQNVLVHFVERKVGLVVRLNSALYSPSYFTALAINHIDMIFDDGTCPPLKMVRRFIKLAHDTIVNKHRAIAVHCRAGLGRTGCLIGAYLIYRHGFTANEIIAYMRFMRPGMVVGPQQHWLHLHQDTFRQWWWEDTMKEKLALAVAAATAGLPPTTPNRSPRRPSRGTGLSTPDGGVRSSKRSPLGEVVQNDALPAPTPGQPRKTVKINGVRYPSEAVEGLDVVREMDKTTTSVATTTKAAPILSSAAKWASAGGKSVSGGAGENEARLDETEVRLRAQFQQQQQHRRRVASRSQSPGGRRTVSCTATTATTMMTTTMTTLNSMGMVSDDENDDRQSLEKGHISPSPPAGMKTPARMKSGNGAGRLGMNKVRTSANGSPKRTNEWINGGSTTVMNGAGTVIQDVNGVVGVSGVRKISGRVGGATTTTAATNGGGGGGIAGLLGKML